MYTWLCIISVGKSHVMSVANLVRAWSFRAVFCVCASFKQLSLCLRWCALSSAACLNIRVARAWPLAGLVVVLLWPVFTACTSPSGVRNSNILMLLEMLRWARLGSGLFLQSGLCGLKASRANGTLRLQGLVGQDVAVERRPDESGVAGDGAVLQGESVLCRCRLEASSERPTIIFCWLPTWKCSVGDREGRLSMVFQGARATKQVSWYILCGLHGEYCVWPTK